MRLASMDVGLKRIGLAICFDNATVMPQKAIVRQNRNQAARDVKNFLIEWQIDRLIVGIPYEGSSSDEMERRIKHFALLIDTQVEIVYQDEQGSSFEAGELIRGEMKHKRDGRLDSLAAKIILERFLEKNR
ncbi:MAG: Holliday junction resolvase [Sulfurovum sp. FS08-3]|nr:MAG: Holliday junction resolvase [Sulfurovum sp. FS08-3]